MANKYRNVRTTVDGITFDSKAEAKRYQELKLLERAGEIRWLVRQREYELLGPHGGVICKYRCDFEYVDDRENRVVTEDVKSKITAKNAAYRLKKKLFEDNFGRTITEVVY